MESQYNRGLGDEVDDHVKYSTPDVTDVRIDNKAFATLDKLQVIVNDHAIVKGGPKDGEERDTKSVILDLSRA